MAESAEFQTAIAHETGRIGLPGPEVLGNGFQRSEVELRIMGDGNVGLAQAFKEAGSDGRKLRRPSDIKPGQAVAVVREFLQKPSLPLGGRTSQ